MQALVYHGPGHLVLEDRPRPALQQPSDAIVKLSLTTICGTDLHIVKGDVPTTKDGTTLGHEGVGVIEQVGASVLNFKVGDHVLISCITSCGRCGNCKKGLYSHCEQGGGWILGNLIDGTQAEYVRIPFADNSLYPIPAGAEERGLVMLSDILPTGFEIGVLSGQVKPGDTVAIVGCGPIGMAAMLTARFFSPSEIIMIDVDENRLAVAKSLGATRTINNQDGKAAEAVMTLTQNRGVDVAIEAIGIPASFALCQNIVAAGGHLANIGVHGKPVQLDLDRLWGHNLTITMGLVDTVTIPMLFRTVLSGKLQPAQLITHTFALKDGLRAYETFGNAMKERAMKVLITAG